MPWQPDPADEAGWERNRRLRKRMERLAAKRGENLRSGVFVSEDVVGALDAGELDEAFGLAGAQAREYLRSFVPPDPPVRRAVIADLTGDFARLARLLGTDLSAAEIRQGLGLRPAWEKAGGDVLAAGPPGTPATGYFAKSCDRITAAAYAGKLKEADLLARQALEALFKAGEPVSIERAVAQYRQLLADGGVEDGVDDAALEHRLGLVHAS